MINKKKELPSQGALSRGGEQALSLGERLRGLSFCSFIMMGKLFKPAEAGAR